MKTDHPEHLKISSTSGVNQATSNRPRIAHIKSVTEEATMSPTNGKSEKVLPADQDNTKSKEEIEALVSQTLFILRKYLSSWAFRDIGPITARSIVSAFGIRTVQVIRSSPRELLNVRGVGEKRMLAVLKGWRFQRKLIKVSAELIKLMSSDQ
jgi:ATP-dependent exoDNAse (exonuclease V) alpha subunit